MQKKFNLKYRHTRGPWTATPNLIKVDTGNEAFKSICWLLGLRSKKPTLGLQHALEAGNLKTMLLVVLAFVL